MDLQRELQSRRLVHFDRCSGGVRRSSDQSSPSTSRPVEQPITPPPRERSNSFTSFPADLISPNSTPNPHFDPIPPKDKEAEGDSIISPSGPVLPAQSSILSSKVSAEQQRIFNRQQRRLERDLDQKWKDPIQRMRAQELEVKKTKIFQQADSSLDEGRSSGTQSSSARTVHFDPVVHPIEDSGHVSVAVETTSRSGMLEETPASILRDLADPSSGSPSLASFPASPIPSGSGGSRRTSTPLTSSFKTANSEITFEDQGTLMSSLLILIVLIITIFLSIFSLS